MAYVRDIQCYLKLSTWGDFQVVSGTETCNFGNRVIGFYLGFIVWGRTPEWPRAGPGESSAGNSLK